MLQFDEFELFLRVQETARRARASVVIEARRAPYRLTGFTSPPRGWLLHGLCIGDAEQLVADTGVPLEILATNDDFEALFCLPIIRVGETVTFILSHTFELPRGARMKMQAVKSLPGKNFH